MSFQSVEQGIKAIQAGNQDEGMRLLKIALKDPTLIGTPRAIACVWLAEVSAEPTVKRAYYDDAMAADPNNMDIRQRAEAFIASQYLPPPPTRTGTITSSMPAVAPTQTVPPQPTTLPGSPAPTPSSPFAPVQPVPPTRQTGSLRPVMQQPTPASNLAQLTAVIGGPNGPGTAFFVAREGLLATTRYVVGGVDRVTIELQGGRQLPGFVVRAFPEYDLALIYVEQTVTDLMTISPLMRIDEGMPLMALSYTGSAVQGRRRASNRIISPQWFPTDITDVPDAGGDPVLDEQHTVIGMITRNTSSTSAHLFALHISAISKLVEMFRQETLLGSGIYCPHCGSYSRAIAAGGYYCEACGAVTRQAENIARFPQPQTREFYTVHDRYACPHCNATVGFYKNMCLRCGQPAS